MSRGYEPRYDYHLIKNGVNNEAIMGLNNWNIRSHGRTFKPKGKKKTPAIANNDQETEVAR